MSNADIKSSDSTPPNYSQNVKTRKGIHVTQIILGLIFLIALYYGLLVFSDTPQYAAPSFRTSFNRYQDFFVPAIFLLLGVFFWILRRVGRQTDKISWIVLFAISIDLALLKSVSQFLLTFAFSFLGGDSWTALILTLSPITLVAIVIIGFLLFYLIFLLLRLESRVGWLIVIILCFIFIGYQGLSAFRTAQFVQQEQQRNEKFAQRSPTWACILQPTGRAWKDCIMATVNSEASYQDCLDSGRSAPFDPATKAFGDICREALSKNRQK